MLKFLLELTTQAPVILTSLPTLARKAAGEDRDIVVVFGGQVTVAGREINQLIGINLAASQTASPLFTAASPANRVITGQISLAGDSEDACLVVTTDRGIYCFG